MIDRFEVVVIGASQSGLAMGYHLARQGRRFVILDAAPRVGHTWRRRWDSLALFTPARFSALPGMAFPGDPDRYPGKDQVADYLEEYARRFALPIRLQEPVVALRAHSGGGGFEIETSVGRYEAEQVVVATSGFQAPTVPAASAGLASSVVQLHSSEYRNPSQLPREGTTLVVGGGNSGVQIASEVARSRPTLLAVGERLGRLPERLLGRSAFWWLEKAGLMRVTIDSRLGRKMSGKELLMGRSAEAAAREEGFRLVGRVTGADGDRVVIEGGEAVPVAAVIWATGFHNDYSWLDLPVLDERGVPVHRRGVTAAPGLYFLGLRWQSASGSRTPRRITPPRRGSGRPAS